MKKKFGDYLRDLRKERALSQQELADLLGTTKQVISKYETNQRTPKITVAAEYAEKLNVPLDFLLTGTSSDSAPEPMPTSDQGVLVFQAGEAVDISDMPKDDQDTIMSFIKMMREKRQNGEGDNGKV